MSTLRRIAGRIHYVTDGSIRGREDFAIDVRENDRTVRAYCEIDEGDLTRDASWTLDSRHQPVEGHVRVVQHGKLVGSTWFAFTGDATECESFTAAMGRASQRLPGRVRYLGLHPLIGDGLIALARGREAPGEQQVIESVTCSYDINGESRLVALPIAIAVTYVGQEEIEVPAGAFLADHYELQWQPHWPPAKLWVHGEDALFLRLSWSVSQTVSELMQYEVADAPASPALDWVPPNRGV